MALQHRQSNFQQKFRSNQQNKEPIQSVQNRIPYQFKLKQHTKDIHDTNFILTTLRSCLVFYNLNEDQLKNIKNSMYLIQIPKGQIIYKQYDVAQCFFIIKKGVIKVMKIFQDIISYIRNGQVLAQSSLILGQNHTETALAQQDAELWILDRLTFSRVVEQTMIKQYQKNLQILSNISFFVGFPQAKKNKLATELIKKIYARGQTIIAEGDPGSSFIFIKEGSATAYKGGQFYKKLLKGDSFGQQSLLYNTIRQYKILADQECTILLLGRDQLHETVDRGNPQKIFGTFIKRALNNNSTLKNLNEKKIKQMISIMRIQAYKENQTIFMEGIQGFQKMVVVIEGQLINKKNGASIAGKGQCYGEQFLLFSKNQQISQEQVVTGTFCVLAEFTDFALSNYFTLKPPNLINDKENESMILRQYKNKKQEWQQVKLDSLYIIGQICKAAFGHISVVSNGKQNYVLKTYQKSLLDQQSVTQLIVNQSQIIRKICHPFILNCATTFQTNQFSCMINQLVEGIDLVDLMNKEGIFTVNSTKFYIANVLLILEYLGNQGIILRDVRPDNFMVQKTGYLKLISLPMAKQLQKVNQVFNKTYTIIGTPHYIAPQIILGKGCTTAVDLWSLGVMTYQLVCGKYPFGDNAETIFEIYEQIMQGQFHFPEFLSDKNTQNFIDKLLSRQPSKRCKSYEQLKQNLWFSSFQWNTILSKQQIQLIPFYPQPNLNILNLPQISLHQYLKQQNQNCVSSQDPIWNGFGPFV